MDTIISTFSATCKSDQLVYYKAEVYYDEAAPIQGSNVRPSRQERKNSEATIDHFEISANPSKRSQLILSADFQHGTYVTAIQNSPGTVRLFGPYLSEANITWSGYYYPAKPGSSESYSLHGTITDFKSNVMLGDVYLTILKDGERVRADHFRVSRNAIDALLQQGAPAPGDYWSSLPSCATAGPFLPSGLNILQQLGTNTGATILQNSP
jgi:hypothetical protein